MSVQNILLRKRLPIPEFGNKKHSRLAHTSCYRPLSHMATMLYYDDWFRFQEKYYWVETAWKSFPHEGLALAAPFFSHAVWGERGDVLAALKVMLAARVFVTGMRPHSPSHAQLAALQKCFFLREALATIGVPSKLVAAALDVQAPVLAG